MNPTPAEIKQNIIYQIRDTWDQILYHHAQLELLKNQTILWKQFSEYAQKRLDAGESNLLEKTTAETTYNALMQEEKAERMHLDNQTKRLNFLMNYQREAMVRITPYQANQLPDNLDPGAIEMNAALQSKLSAIDVAKADFEVYRANRKPDFQIGYFVQSFKGIQDIDGEIISENASPRFHGGSIGVGIPLIGKGYKALQNSAATAIKIKEEAADVTRAHLETEIDQLNRQYRTYREYLDYFEQSALVNAELIKNNATKAYESGEIGYIEYVQALYTGFEIEQNHLGAIHKLNRTINSILYLMNL